MVEMKVPSWRLKEEAEKRRIADAEANTPREQNQAFRIELIALGADPKEIIAELGHSLPLRCPEARDAS